MANWSPVGRIVDRYRRRIFALFRYYFNYGLNPPPNFWLDVEAERIAQEMVTGLAGYNRSTWQAAASASMKGRLIRTALMQEMQGPVGARVHQLVNENAALIRSVPINLAETLTRKIAERSGAGTRASAIAGELRAGLPRLARARAQLIARTETSKVTTALTQARSEDLGLDWYVWRTSKDQRVRLSHRHLEGVLVSWAEPASPEDLAHQKSTLGYYAPGNAPNCRCYPEPLLRLEDVRWPHRVYYRGRVTYMNRFQFSQLYGPGQRAAA